MIDQLSLLWQNRKEELHGDTVHIVMNVENFERFRELLDDLLHPLSE